MLLLPYTLKRLLKRARSNVGFIVNCVDRRRTAKRLMGAVRLHLGCGSHHFDGWANIDFGGAASTIKWDLTTAIPGKPGSVRIIYSEHFLEHITRAEGALHRKNCFDLLMPGGVLRISTPRPCAFQLADTIKGMSSWYTYPLRASRRRAATVAMKAMILTECRGFCW
jgi:predicted SAM-dependent methyltransferase